MTDSHWRSALWTILALGLVLRVYFLIATPYHVPEIVGELSAYNDEPAHVAYTQHVLETGKLPGSIEPITKSLRSQRPSFENYQSPLYYMIHAGMCRTFGITSEKGIMYCGRVLSLLCMVILTWIVFLFTREFKLTQLQSLLAISFASLSGVFVRFSTQAGNEAMAWLFAGLVTLAFLKLINRIHPRPLFALILILAAGIYVKLSLLLLVPLVMLALLLCFRDIPRSALFATVVLSIITIPLFIYNNSVFGSPIPLTSGFGEPSWRLPNLETGKYLARSLVFPWSELWRSWLGLVLLLPGLIVTMWFASLALTAKAPLRWSLVLVATVILAYMGLNIRYDQAEARYLFMAWPALLPAVSTVNPSLRWTMAAIASLILPYTLFVI